MTAPSSRSGGLAAWSIRHPVGVVMIALAVAVVGVFSFFSLSVDLLPRIMYPGIRVRIQDPGVPAVIMEDKVTRQLEEQLAITEDVIAIQSRTSEGSSSVDLTFQYGKDIDIALRDASTRLDRAKRYLPDTILPPNINKFDPAQIPALEFVVVSPLLRSMELRDWTDYVFSKWFINLPGVAAVEVGGGSLREIWVEPDPARLASLGLSLTDVVHTMTTSGVEIAAGRLDTGGREFSGRTDGRFTSVEQLIALPLKASGDTIIHLGDVAEVLDSHEDERVLVRLNGQVGVKASIQKQPNANTVSVTDLVKERLDWIQKQGFLPTEAKVESVSDQSIYIRNALGNATSAAWSGSLLAMMAVYLFLGDIRRTLVVGLAIPLSLLVTFVLMGLGGLSLNIMSLGGLALGVGMVVDSTIVLLENIQRHQNLGLSGLAAGEKAATEVNSAIVASTTTNLAAILPFLFISGLSGLLFKELIFTISAAIFASMLAALTLAPALAARIPTPTPGRLRRGVDWTVAIMGQGYSWVLSFILERVWLRVFILLAFVVALGFSIPTFFSDKQLFLPSMDDGRIEINVTADPGIPLASMDAAMKTLEAAFMEQKEVVTVFSLVGGRVFGRSQTQTANRSSLTVQLVPLDQRNMGSEAWVKSMQQKTELLLPPGFTVRMRTGTIRGVRVGAGDDDVALRIAGSDPQVMDTIGFDLLERLKGLSALKNLVHSSEEVRVEVVIRVDRIRATELNLSVEDVANAAHMALDGELVGRFYEKDRGYDIRMRLPRGDMDSLEGLEGVMVVPGRDGSGPVLLADVATVELVAASGELLRDNQRRITEVTASLSGTQSLKEVKKSIDGILKAMNIPSGYVVYDAGASTSLQESQRLTGALLGLALFLVFAVMAVQYESLGAPLLILLGIPFGLIGVALGLQWLDVPLSMPVWLGVIMLSGIVVNNSIVLVEYVIILREEGMVQFAALVEAARVRLRPILMTTLTTVLGLLPLAMGAGEGSEMLRPLAVVVAFGLTFSTLVSLLLIPILYPIFMPSDRKALLR